ncbi:MAG: family 78 glycoside hydrolase catalytic domain [Myxococcales bacterium]
MDEIFEPHRATMSAFGSAVTRVIGGVKSPLWKPGRTGSGRLLLFLFIGGNLSSFGLFGCSSPPQGGSTGGSNGTAATGATSGGAGSHGATGATNGSGAAGADGTPTGTGGSGGSGAAPGSPPDGAPSGGNDAGGNGDVAGAGGNAPSQTRIVDNFDQIVDVQEPRFAWVVNDTARGEAQTGYQLIVSADEAAITANKGPLWDSGKVASAQQFGVVYAGPALTKTSKYWWKVRTWNKKDQASTWSAANMFVTSFFQPTDWDKGAQWIRHPKAVSAATNGSVMLRKSFMVAKSVKQAYLYVTGLGQFVATLNGKKIGNHEIDPAQTDYTVTVNYVTFDVTQQLVMGSNAMGVMLGIGWLTGPKQDSGRYGVLRMFAQLHVVYTDGTSMEVVSDPTWKVKESPFGVNMNLHGIEDYDARLLPAGWDTGTFDDSSWVASVPATVPSSVALVAQSSPPVVTHETLSAVKVTSAGANTSIYDFGRNMNGVFEITVSGKAGAAVALTPGESVSGTKVNAGHSGPSTYTLKGGGPETWRLTFSTIGMRYLQVSGASQTASDAVPTIMDVKAFPTYTASTDVGTFMSSDDRYKKVHDMVQRTLQSNLTSIHTDGPNYEKLGWQEVVWTTLSSSSYQQDVWNLFTKIMHDLRDGQRTSGQVSSIVPNPFGGKTAGSGGVYDDAPAWGGSAIQAPWTLYNVYGDIRILQDNYAMMKAYLAYLKTKEAGGLVKYGLGDWMAPGGTAVANVEGAVYVADTRVVRDVATALGNTADATLYGAEFTRVQTAYNNAYFDSASSRYTPTSQANIAMPLELGIVPAGMEAAVATALVKDIGAPMERTTGSFGAVQANHITTGDIGTTFLWRALGDYNQADLVQTMIMQPALPSYMSMINAGETTVTEDWNVSSTRSHNHDMYAGIFEWFYRSLGGISSSKPGYAEVQFKPGMPTGLASVTVSYNSVRGLITSAWNRATGMVQWKVGVPVNATAKVFLPTFATAPAGVTVSEGGTAIFKNGAAAGSVPGVTFDRVEGVSPQAFVVFTVGSGTYQFAWNVSIQ